MFTSISPSNKIKQQTLKGTGIRSVPLGILLLLKIRTMKRICTGLLVLISYLSFGQNDTTEIDLTHLALEDVLIVDSWEKKHALKPTVDNHQLELQLKQLKGVNLISRGSFAQEVVYRGQSDGRIQVKLNGMRIYNACTDRMDPSTSYVVANNLSTAEVASSCENQCSNNGLAGSLNLKTKEPTFSTTDPWRLGFSQQYQTNTKGLNSAFYLEHNTRKLAWRLNGTWFKNGNYFDGHSKEILHSQNEKQNWAINSIYKLSPKRFIKLDFIYDLATKVGYPALPMDVGKACAVIGGITYSSHHNIGPFTHFEIKLYHNDIYHEMDDSQREDVFMNMDMPGWSRTTGFTFNAFDWKAGKHNFDFFAEYYTNFRRAEMTMNPDNGAEPPMFMFTWPDARIHGSALGISDHWHFGNNMLASTFRIDYETSRVMGKTGKDQWQGMGYDMTAKPAFLLPQVKSALTHLINKKNSLTTAISFGMRGPTTSELYGFYLFNAHDGFDYLGNPALEAEQLFATEVGYNFTAEKLKLTSTVFTQFYSNYIFGLATNFDEMTYGANGVREYRNVDNATFWGVDFGANYVFDSNLSSTIKIDFLRGFKPDFDLPLVPPLQGVLTVNYKYSQFSFLAQSRMAAEQNHYNAEYGDRYTPGYILLDAGVEYKLPIKKSKASLSLSTNNIFNTYYRNHLNWGGIPSMGRILIFTLKIKV